MLLRPRPLAALAAVLCLAGCGPPKPVTPGHYTLKPTASCLTKSGLRVAKSMRDIIASTAPAGALSSSRDGKSFVIAFGNTEEDAIILVKGYERVAPTRQARRRLHSLLDREGNALIYWHTEPTDAQSKAVRSCLS